MQTPKPVNEMPSKKMAVSQGVHASFNNSDLYVGRILKSSAFAFYLLLTAKLNRTTKLTHPYKNFDE